MPDLMTETNDPAELATQLREVADGLESGRFTGRETAQLLERIARHAARLCQCGRDDRCCPITDHDHHTSPHVGCVLR